MIIGDDPVWQEARGICPYLPHPAARMARTGHPKFGNSWKPRISFREVAGRQFQGFGRANCRAGRWKFWHSARPKVPPLSYPKGKIHCNCIKIKELLVNPH